MVRYVYPEFVVIIIEKLSPKGYLTSGKTKHKRNVNESNKLYLLFDCKRVKIDPI